VRYKKLWAVDGAITNLLETPKLSTSSGNLTITCNTGNVIVSERPIRPDVTATHPLGSVSLRWSSVFTGTTDSNVAVISPLLGATTGNTTLRAGVGSEIRTDEILVPSVNNTLSCGTSARRWSTVFATTVDATTVIGTTLGATTGNTTLVAGVGSAVRSSHDVIPTAPTLNVGSATNVWENGYFKNLVVTGSANYKSFNMAALTLTSNTFIKMPIFIGGGGPFDAGSNQIRFPKTGLYSISFTSKGDPGVIIVNAAYFRLWNATTATAASDPDGLLHDLGGQPALPRDQFFFYVDITNTSHLIEIQYRRSNFDITNFSIADGMISAVHTTS
jgi:hypothetical protein